jgi:hypothetical protein
MRHSIEMPNIKRYKKLTEQGGLPLVEVAPLSPLSSGSPTKRDTGL